MPGFAAAGTLLAGAAAFVGGILASPVVLTIAAVAAGVIVGVLVYKAIEKAHANKKPVLTDAPKPDPKYTEQQARNAELFNGVSWGSPGLPPLFKLPKGPKCKTPQCKRAVVAVGGASVIAAGVYIYNASHTGGDEDDSSNSKKITPIPQRKPCSSSYPCYNK